MTSFPRWTFLLFLLGFAAPLSGQPIREYMDLQTHPTMHMAYGFFGQGLEYIDESHPPKLSHKHLLTNVNYANFIEQNEGARIIVHGAIVPEVLVSKRSARKRILAQLAFVNDFVEAHADRFAVARSPQEVRELVHTTDKTIILHSIEGAKRLLDGPEDARFWADQGVAFMTLIHLIDDEFGTAAVLPDLSTRVINYRAALKGVFAPKRKEQGLTEKGRQAIQWLADAGIMIDLTHMSDASRADALAYMEAEGIPPLVTHDMFKPVQNHARGIAPEDILRIYRLGGMVSLPISGVSNLPHDPTPTYQARIDALEEYCEGSIDTYRFTYEVLKEYVEGEVAENLLSGSSFRQLTESGKVDFAIGFQTDFNGWLDHHRPRYGDEGCFEVEAGQEYEAVELEGMPHPGLLASHWRWLEKEGVDLEPVLRASEKFLQMWESFLERRGAVGK